MHATEGIRSEGSEERPEPLRAIVADDDAFARRMIKDALQGAGIIVIAEAQNGREAVELTLFYRPSIVVMDVVMPGMDGIAATRQIIKEQPEQVIVLLTSADEEDMGLLGLRAGASGFLSKDVEINSVPRALLSALEGEAAISRRLSMRLIEHLRHAPEGSRGRRAGKSAPTPRGVGGRGRG